MTFDVIVPISALEHWSYCPRQCGLIHLESVWDENVFTVRGSQTHERVDSPVKRMERGVRVERALPVWSDRLGLVGKCDVVEFHPTLPDAGRWGGRSMGGRIVPVEYKSGGPNHARHAAVQLCAQALCLEEMFETEIVEGALFFAKSKARVQVEINQVLRDSTLQAITDVRMMFERSALPPPVNDRRCPRCSLIDACMPRCVARAASWIDDPFTARVEKALP